MPVDSIAAPSTECLGVAAIGAKIQHVGIRMTMITKETAKSMTKKTFEMQSGSVVLEFALILPMFVFVGLMLVDLQLMTRDIAALEYITTETARCEAIDSPACTTPPLAEAFALKLATNARLTGISLQIPPCDVALGTCSVSAKYNLKPLGAYFPKITIERSGFAAIK